MYEDIERPSPLRIALTVGGILLGIIAVIVVAGMAISASMATPTRSMPVEPVEVATEMPAAEETSASWESEAEQAPSEEPDFEIVDAPTIATPQAIGVVTIDAGHQATADSSLEPIGPGASETKPKVAGGTRGVVTGAPESVRNLEIALQLRDALEASGVTVVMVRETENVNISNSERAAIANNADSDLFIRLHCDGGPGSSNGISMLVPAANQWTGPIVEPSRRAGEIVHRAILEATGARDLGVNPRSDIAGFNWATVPTILPEMGFMTNSDEDRRLADPTYQKKLVEGMASGIVEFLQSD